MTVRSTLRFLEHQLRIHGVNEARREAEMMLCSVLDTTMIEILAYPDRILSYEQQQAVTYLLEQRTRHRIPLQYLLGSVAFLGLELTVTPDVLIPRPETEYLVECFTAWCGQVGVVPSRVLDIGTGSGCIALGVARLFPTSQVVGWDISPNALAVARRNALANRVDNVEFVHQDLFAPPPPGKYDAIISNPPYIPYSEYAELPPEIKHEPMIALTDGGDGMRFYRRLVEIIPQLLSENGIVVVECGWGQAPIVAALLQRIMPATAIGTDFAGVERYVVGAATVDSDMLRFFSLQKRCTVP